MIRLSSCSVFSSYIDHIMHKTGVDQSRRKALQQLAISSLIVGFLPVLPAWADGQPIGNSAQLIENGQPIENNDKPIRVITLFQGATDTAVALGIKPLAVVESWREKPVYRYLRSELQDVVQIGLETQPSLEDIALLEPDLIIASRFRHQAIASLLEQLAPVVMLDQVYHFRETLLQMGRACQREQQAQWLMACWQQRVRGLKQQIQQVFADRPPTVSVLDIRADHIRSYLPNSFAGSVLTELGFIWTTASQQAAQQPKTVSIRISNKESLPVVNAELFFVFLRANKPSVQQHYHSLQQHPLWQQMQAPRNQRIRQVDGVAWSLSGGILGANQILDDIQQMLLEEAAA